MISARNVGLVVIFLGPVAWRKLTSWRQERMRAAQSPLPTHTRRFFFSLPRPLILPSNLLLGLTFLALIYIHTSYLLLPAAVLSRSDLFLLTKTSVHASTSTIRSRLASMSFAELGWKSEWGEEGLETLLRRLSSFDGRRLHLMIGTSPFLSCSFCHSSLDYQLFSLSDLLWQLSTNLVLFGLLTARCDSLEMFDEVVYSTLQTLTGRNVRLTSVQAKQEAGRMRADGHGYRTLLLYLLGSFALAQAFVYLNLFGISFGQGRWDHWHSNFSLAFHLSLLLSSIWVYLGQRTPAKPAMAEIAGLIGESRLHSNQALSHVQAMHLSNQLIWADAGLRERTAGWFDGNKALFEQMMGDEAIQSLSSQAQQAGIDVGSLRQASQTAARQVWQGSQGSGNEWERALSLQQPGPSL